MTEHSIEELERQWKAARDRANEARAKAREAKERLYKAKSKKAEQDFAAQGITRGTKVYAIRGKWGEEIKSGPYGFMGCEPGILGDPSPIFMRLKKDGTIGRSKAAYVHFKRLEVADD